MEQWSDLLSEDSLSRADMPELKPVENGPLLPQTTGAASPVEEAGTIRHETGAGRPRPSVVVGCHLTVTDFARFLG